ncbi:hypothetical protein Desde_3840 [Desulfitobacterium dehalogenans ATCC 51507]|uniref:Uncharacterized protein n=1 Tax=Desulfitobacterium dehalogenans (strain ATCC 51507 / DSM 9161 / JW/IU-DC1) TaxID=756499 RepID=I4ADS2_DESDJ|nr:hypothetical protein [Desulfitobacterium dehalogenans]AFM02107.1 hypothetical protein Desde_3840 [Desulfitobacterium dehalogenans ATCC 51507]
MKLPQKDAAPLSEVEAFEQTCCEFTRLLYEYSQEEYRLHQAEVKVYQNRIAEMETRCREYESRLFEGGAYRGELEKKFAKQDRKRQRCASRKERIRKFFFQIAQSVFRLGRRLSGQWGIKDRLKGTTLFKRLYLKGTIDRLRG